MLKTNDESHQPEEICSLFVEKQDLYFFESGQNRIDDLAAIESLYQEVVIYP